MPRSWVLVEKLTSQSRLLNLLLLDNIAPLASCMLNHGLSNKDGKRNQRNILWLKLSD